MKLPREALILAAGKSSRMPTSLRPKVLLKIKGLTLLQRHFKGLKSLGVKRFVVVVGYEKEKVKRYLKSLEYDIEIMENEKINKGNAYSVFLGIQKLKKDNFFLVMGDHLFDYFQFKQKIFGKIKKVEAPLVVFVDKSPLYMKPEWCTKVRLKKGKVDGWGKKLRKFDGIDMGIFVVQLNLLKQIKRTLKKEKEWNKVIRVITKYERVEAIEVDSIP
ncbi:MAG: NTP transferase domain-containing protein, partial [Candidatus Aenigmarchaeota archaeon]|nr:NTP transferase domain-containing protein [Candidatus Aenigmarchaeota archaeon]